MKPIRPNRRVVQDDGYAHDGPFDLWLSLGLSAVVWAVAGAALLWVLWS